MSLHYRIRVELPVAIAKKSWIRVLDTRSCYERAAPPRGRIEGPCGFAFTTRLIGQKFISVCTIAQLPELRHGDPYYISMHALYYDHGMQPDRFAVTEICLCAGAEFWSLFVRQASDLPRFDEESF